MSPYCPSYLGTPESLASVRRKAQCQNKSFQESTCCSEFLLYASCWASTALVVWQLHNKLHQKSMLFWHILTSALTSRRSFPARFVSTTRRGLKTARARGEVSSNSVRIWYSSLCIWMAASLLVMPSSWQNLFTACRYTGYAAQAEPYRSGPFQE